MNTITIKIENLKCHGCAFTVKKGIQQFDEVEDVTVDLKNSAVNIIFSGGEEEANRYKKKLEQLGYPESGHNSTFSVVKSFVSCAKGRMER